MHVALTSLQFLAGSVVLVVGIRWCTERAARWGIAFTTYGLSLLAATLYRCTGALGETSVADAVQYMADLLLCTAPVFFGSGLDRRWSIPSAPWSWFGLSLTSMLIFVWFFWDVAANLFFFGILWIPLILLLSVVASWKTGRWLWSLQRWRALWLLVVSPTLLVVLLSTTHSVVRAVGSDAKLARSLHTYSKIVGRGGGAPRVVWAASFLGESGVVNVGSSSPDRVAWEDGITIKQHIRGTWYFYTDG